MIDKQYAVYDKQDNIVMVGNAQQCAKFMGIKLNSFYSQITRVKNGKIKSGREYNVYKVEEWKNGLYYSNKKIKRNSI